MDRQWYQDAVFYEIFVRSFYDSNGDGWGDLPGVTAKLDYLQWLGVDCIWLLPFFDSPLKDGGYDVSDFYAIHPKYGTLEDFKTLIKEAHARDIKVIGDLVLNHTSDENAWFQEARDPNSPKHDWYVWSDTTDKYTDARIIFTDYEDSNWQWDEKAGKYYWHRFFRFQPDLNYDNPEVQQEMINVAKYWLELGLDGFRLDAVPHLYEREGTDCENLPETHAYLRKLRAEVDKVKPGAVLLAETNQVPEKLLPYFNNGDECNMAFHFPVMVDIFNAIRKHDGSELLQAVAKTPQLPAGAQWGLFLRNHDELSPKRHLPDGEHAPFLEHYASAPGATLKAGLRRRLAPMFDFSLDKLKVAYILLLTLPGTPVLYYGDELGMGDDLSLNDRDPVRTPMPWADTSVGFSSSKKLPLSLSSGEGGYSVVNVIAQRAQQDSLLNWLKEMLKMRKQYDVLRKGEFEAISGTDGVIVFERRSGRQRVRCVVNVSPGVRNVNNFMLSHTISAHGYGGGALESFGFVLYTDNVVK